MIYLVYGTRPEAIKLGPVANELRNLSVPFQIICTGQHTTLLKGSPAEFDLQPDITVAMPQGDDLRIQVAADQISKLVNQEDIVVVQGDTASALAGAIGGYNSGAPIAHVEAGIRSHDLENPFPEEFYRREISLYAHTHFAPTAHCVENLRQEGIDENVWLTGNPIVSALHRYTSAKANPPTNHILMTMHRREFINRGAEEIRRFWDAVQSWTDGELGIRICWPVHPSLQPIVGPYPVYRNFWPSAPLPYSTTQSLLRNALGVITDSGGLTEEAVTLGIPVAVLRVVNDRPEAEGTNICRRFDPTPEGFAHAANWLRAVPQSRRGLSTFGHANAATKIASHLKRLNPEHENAEKHGKTLRPSESTDA